MIYIYPIPSPPPKNKISIWRFRGWLKVIWKYLKGISKFVRYLKVKVRRTQEKRVTRGIWRFIMKVLKDWVTLERNLVTQEDCHCTVLFMVHTYLRTVTVPSPPRGSRDCSEWSPNLLVSGYCVCRK